MITLKGKYTSANIMIDTIDEETQRQIYTFLNHPAFKGAYIVIMPDCHSGAGAVIGFTGRLNGYVIPNVVGVDIGCGVLAVKISGLRDRDLGKAFKFEDLDKYIRSNVPSGFSHHAKEALKRLLSMSEAIHFTEELDTTCNKTGQQLNTVLLQWETLGGGNHFIEIGRTADGEYWLIIHTGSRNFGLKVANYYQKQAKELLSKMFAGADAYKDLEYMPMDMGGADYIEAMRVAQRFASINRYLIAHSITAGFFGTLPYVQIESVHNYIDVDTGIIRKGAISAEAGEQVVIPLNMRDGVVFGTGKGNKKWNCSAPHGAGRLLSRRKAKDTLSIDEYKETMDGVWSSCISENTLDESPMAYKDGQEIIGLLDETVQVDFVAKPVYSFKAS